MDGWNIVRTSRASSLDDKWGNKCHMACGCVIRDVTGWRWQKGHFFPQRSWLILATVLLLVFLSLWNDTESHGSLICTLHSCESLSVCCASQQLVPLVSFSRIPSQYCECSTSPSWCSHSTKPRAVAVNARRNQEWLSCLLGLADTHHPLTPFLCSVPSEALR